MAWVLLCLSVFLILAEILLLELFGIHLSICSLNDLFLKPSDMTHMKLEIDKVTSSWKNYPPSFKPFAKEIHEHLN